MADKKLIIPQKVSWKRVVWFVALTYAVSFLLCGFSYNQGKKLDPELPAIKHFVDITKGDPAAVARYLEMHPDLKTEDLPGVASAGGTVIELNTIEEKVAVYVSQKHLGIQVFGLMMIFPALIAIILRFVFKDGFRNSGFRFGKAKNYFIMLGAIVIFVLFSILLNALIWQKVPDWGLEGMGLQKITLMGKTVSPFVFWLFQFLVVGMVANLTFPIIMMFGEEYGWRSYLLQNLLPLGFWKANLITGAVWGLWHAPVILMGYNYGYYNVSGVFIFILVCMMLGTFFNYMYIRANSVILVSAAHGWFNGMVPSVVMLTSFMGKETLLAPLGLVGLLIMLVLLLIGYKITNGYDISGYVVVEAEKKG